MTGVRRTVAAGACGVLALAALVVIVSWLPGPYGLRRGPSALLLAAAVGYALAHAPLTVRRTRHVMSLSTAQRAQYRGIDSAGWVVRAEWCLVVAGLVAVWAVALTRFPHTAWFTAPAPATLGLPLVYALSAAVRTGLKGRPAGRTACYVAAIIAYVAVAAFAPFTVLIYLTAQGAVRSLIVGLVSARAPAGRAASGRAASGRAASGRPSGTERPPAPGEDAPEAGADTEGDLGELRDVLATRTPAEIRALRPRIGTRLAALAAERPETTVHVLFDVLEADPDFARSDAMTEFVRGWLCGAPEATLIVTGDRLAALLGRYDTGLIECLADALDAKTVRRLSGRTRVLLADRALAAVAREDAPATAATAWDLLARVAPAGAPTSRGGWLCVLGDRALRDGAAGVAVRRYVAAVEAGCREAEPRLAHTLAAEGRRLLADGDAAAAGRAFGEALRLRDDPVVRLLAGVTELAAGPDGAAGGGWRAHLERAAAADETATPALLWTGIAATLTGDRTGAAAALHAAARRPADAASEAARLILGLLGDPAELAAGARALFARHGADWHRYCPVPPDGLLAAVTAPAVTVHDPGLPGDLARTLPGSRDGEGARERAVAAHRMLAAAADAMARDARDIARDRLETAELLLDGDPA